jgi:hypothetical protein
MIVPRGPIIVFLFMMMPAVINGLPVRRGSGPC